MNILITGGLGFIGTNLAIRLLKECNKIYIIDDLSSGLIDNLKVIQKYGKVDFYKQNICDKLPDINVDEIYNLACDASPKFYQSDMLATIKSCTYGLFNLLEFAKRNNAKFLQSSTSEVYGNPLENPQKEEYLGNVSCTGIRSCYDEGKRVAESIALNYYRQYNLDVKIVRIFNTYGPYMRKDDGRVVSNFINQILDNKPITIYGNGSQTRSICYIDDLIDGLIKLMSSSQHFPINIGNNEEYTVKQLADIICQEMNMNQKYVYCDLPEDDPMQRKPDITKAEKLLNWKPKYSVKNGLNKTIKYFKEIHK